MEAYAKGNEDFREYFTKSFGWLILFSVLAGLAVLLFIGSTICVSSPRCCL